MEFTYIDENGNAQTRIWPKNSRELLGGFHAAIIGKSGAGKTHLSQQVIDIPWLKKCRLLLADGNGMNTLKVPKKLEVVMSTEEVPLTVPRVADSILKARGDGVQLLVIDSLDRILNNSYNESLEKSNTTKRGNSKGAMHHKKNAHEHFPRLLGNINKCVQSGMIVVTLTVTEPHYIGPYENRTQVGFKPRLSLTASEDLKSTTDIMWTLERLPTDKFDGTPITGLQERRDGARADWDNCLHIAHTAPGPVIEYAKTRAPPELSSQIPRIWKYPSIPRVMWSLIKSRSNET